MKWLILLALPLSFAANAGDAVSLFDTRNEMDVPTYSQACEHPVLVLQECAYQAKRYFGDQFKSVCEKPIKDFIVAYYGPHKCGIYVGYADAPVQLNLEASINQYIYAGRYRDELKARAESKAKELEELKRKKEVNEIDKAFNGVKIF